MDQLNRPVAITLTKFAEAQLTRDHKLQRGKQQFCANCSQFIALREAGLRKQPSIFVTSSTPKRTHAYLSMYAASKSKVSDLPVIIQPYTCISFPVLRRFVKNLIHLAPTVNYKLFLFGYIYLIWPNWSWVRIWMLFYKPCNRKGAPNMIQWSILHVRKVKITNYCNQT